MQKSKVISKGRVNRLNKVNIFDEKKSMNDSLLIKSKIKNLSSFADKAIILNDLSMVKF